MSRWTLADVEKIGLDRLVRPMPKKGPSKPQKQRKRQKAQKSARAEKSQGRSKYHAQPTVVDGIRFDSQKESRRYVELKLLEQAGEITLLEHHKRFDLRVHPIEIGVPPTIGQYEADFDYLSEKDGRGWIVEDTKGFRTALYRWKKKHFEAQYGIKITEL